MNLERPIVLIGAGGHACVVADACERGGLAVAGYLAPQPAGRTMAELPRLGDDGRLDDAAFVQAHRFLIALGDTGLRCRVGGRLEWVRADLATVVHPSAVVSRHAVLGAGTFVAAGAVINPGVQVGQHAIINTRASVDHDCVLGAYVQVAPGATLGGAVICGEATMIGIGATVRQGIRIGRDVMVGAGAVVVNDLPDGLVAVGIPARPKNNIKSNH